MEWWFINLPLHDKLKNQDKLHGNLVAVSLFLTVHTQSYSWRTWGWPPLCSFQINLNQSHVKFLVIFAMIGWYHIVPLNTVSTLTVLLNTNILYAILWTSADTMKRGGRAGGSKILTASLHFSWGNTSIVQILAGCANNSCFCRHTGIYHYHQLCPGV